MESANVVINDEQCTKDHFDVIIVSRINPQKLKMFYPRSILVDLMTKNYKF